jgi:hypothetical protein
MTSRLSNSHLTLTATSTDAVTYKTIAALLKPKSHSTFLSAVMAQAFSDYGSLISAGLRSQRKDEKHRIVDCGRNSAPHVTQDIIQTTIAVHEIHSSPALINVPPQPQVGPQLFLPPKARRAPHGWDHQKQPPVPVFSCFSENTVVHKGFGRYLLEKEPVTFEERTRAFPPLPNAAYEQLKNNILRSSPPRFTPTLDGAAFVKEYLLEKRAEDEKAHEEELFKRKSPTLGELAAQKIDWQRALHNGGELGQSVPADTTNTTWRKDFVTAIDNAKSVGQEPFSLCGKCGQRHIPWGPTVTLQDRDTCLSMLPRWFPAEKFDKPWNTFIEIINYTLKDDEKEQKWDKEFHEPTREWVAVGRYGGWWKCRSGFDTKEPISKPERECRLCHRPRTQDEQDREKLIQMAAERKIETLKWIKHCMKVEMKKDRAFVEARIRYEGY